MLPAEIQISRNWDILFKFQKYFCCNTNSCISLAFRSFQTNVKDYNKLYFKKNEILTGITVWGDLLTLKSNISETLRRKLAKLGEDMF